MVRVAVMGPSGAGKSRSTDLSCEEVTIWAGSKRLLAPATLTFPPGQLHAVVGPSGAGKTTLLQAISGLSRHRVAGRVSWAGRALSPTDCRRWIEFVGTQPTLIPELRLRDALLGEASLCGRSDAVALDLASRLGLAGCLDTPILQLSSGEQKRAQLAFELLSDAKVLCFDEPTCSLSDTDALRFVECLVALLQDRPTLVVVLVSHQPRAAIFRLFSTLTIVANGGVLAQGDSSRLLAAAATTGEEGSDALGHLLDRVSAGWTPPDLASESSAKRPVPGCRDNLPDTPRRRCCGSGRTLVGWQLRWLRWHWTLVPKLVFATLLGTTCVQVGNASTVGNDYALYFKVTLLLAGCFNMIAFHGVYQAYTSWFPRWQTFNHRRRASSVVLALTPLVVDLAQILVVIPTLNAPLCWIVGVDVGRLRFGLIFYLHAQMAVLSKHVLLWCVAAPNHNMVVQLALYLGSACTGVFTPVEELPTTLQWFVWCNPLFYSVQGALLAVDPEYDDAPVDYATCLRAQVGASVLLLVLLLLVAQWRVGALHPSS